jgi:predicted Zn-dependent protease
VAGLWCLYETGEHGGELVYGYAGGVGIRSGDPADVERLLLAGLYHQAAEDRKTGRAEDAAALVDVAVRRFPDDPEVQLLSAESLLIDRRDAAGALAVLDRVAIAPENRPLYQRRGSLRVDALEATGQREAAVAELQRLIDAFPANARFKQRMEQLKGSSAADPAGAP